VQLKRTDRLLSRAFTIYDLRDIAKKRTSRLSEATKPDCFLIMSTR
jgi:hypothetical protein